MSDGKSCENKSKKEKRWESKKNKVKAFLEIAKLNDKDKEKASEVIEDIKESVCPNEDKNGNMKSGKPLDMDDLQVLRQQLRERQKLAMQKSKIFGTLDHVHIPCALCSAENFGKSTTKANDALQTPTMGMEQPLFGVDIQHLILYGIQGQISSWRPRWCKLLRPEKLKQVVVLEMANITKEMFLSHQESLEKLKEIGFSMCVEVISPAQYNSTFLKDISQVPLSNNTLKKQGKKKTTVERRSDNIKRQVALAQTNEKDWACSPTELLMSTRQMIIDAYPMPVDLDKYSDFLYTADGYKKVTERSPLFALDCEMCQTDSGENELTYIAVVNEKLETIYVTLVKPRNKVINYLTKYSGVTKALLKNVTTRLEEVQEKLREILPPDAILCGQSFGSDLKALKMFHPYVIDTSVIFNLSGNYHKTSLKRMTQFFLNKSIQDDPLGHSPEEDALATMELVLLKLRKGLSFGDVNFGPVLLDRKSDNPDQEEENKKEVKKNPEEPDIYRKTVAEAEKRKMESNTNEDEPKKKKKKNKEEESEDSSSSSSEEEEKSNSEKNDSSKQIVETSSKDSSHTQQKFVFFKPLGDDNSENMFKLVKEAGKKVTIVGQDDLSDECLKDLSESDRVHVHTNRECKKACTRAVQNGDSLVWATFDTSLGRNDGEEEEEEDKDVQYRKAFRKMSKVVSKVAKKCSPSSLLMLLLAGGQTATSSSNGVCLLKIT